MRPTAAIGAILVMIGLLVRGVSLSDRKQIDAFGETPERITLQALIERGPRGPKNVIITDFVPCENYVIVKRVPTQYGQPVSDGVVERCYVPLAPRTAGPGGFVDARPLRVHVVVHCPLGDDSADTIQRCSGPELRGLVEGTVTDLSPGTKRLLAEQYPHTDQMKCVVVTEGAAVVPVAPPSVTRRVGGWAIGFGCVFLGVAAVLRLERRAVTPRS